jgi:hypothetical protein
VISSLYFSTTTLRLTFIVGVISPPSTVNSTCRQGRCRPLYRGLVQPAPPSLFAWLPQPQPIRTEVFLEPGPSRVINPSTFSREGQHRHRPKNASALKWRSRNNVESARRPRRRQPNSRSRRNAPHLTLRDRTFDFAEPQNTYARF